MRHGTRDPDWVGDEGDGGFELPFFVPEPDEWGETPWPPMCLEVSSFQMNRTSPRIATLKARVAVRSGWRRQPCAVRSAVVGSIHRDRGSGTNPGEDSEVPGGCSYIHANNSFLFPERPSSMANSKQSSISFAPPMASMFDPRAQIRCYDHDLLGPPDLIGCVKLGPDAILGLVRLVATTGKNGYRGTSVTDPSFEVTWLELIPDVGDDTTTPDSGSTTTAQRERNPFASLGDVAVALTARRPLPGSIEEYGRAKEEKQSTITSSLAIAEAGVVVSVPRHDSVLCSRERLIANAAHGRCRLKELTAPLG